MMVQHCDETSAHGAARHLHRLTVTVLVAMLCGLGLSPRLWLSSARLYPASPVNDSLSRVPFPWDYLWLAATVALLCAALASRGRRHSLAAFLVAATLLALFDQTRWQPWFYQYLLMLTAVVVYAPSGNREAGVTALGVCRVIVAAVYFWSGAHKLNLEFGSGTMPSLLTASLGTIREGPLPPQVAILSWLAPLIEMFIGVALLTQRARTAAVLLAVTTHLIVLALLVSTRYNSVVWPWNVAMATFCVLFWRDRYFSLPQLRSGLRWHEQAAIITVLVMLPALGFLGRWDAYPSFSLYSGRTHIGLLHFDEGVHARLPLSISALAERVASGGFLLPIDRWTYAELNVPAYPEPRVYRDVARRLCVELGGPEDLRLEILEPPAVFARDSHLSFVRCEQLTAAPHTQEGNVP